MNLRIALDIDDCIAGFYDSYEKKHGANNPNHVITRHVYSLRNNKEFWEGLSVIDRPDFEPHIYCTKRINSKTYTKNWLKKNNFPNKPIYQMYHQNGNKADMIKGRCDVLIDDSYFNVKKCIESGLPALLITRDHNETIDTPYRINSLKYKDIKSKYEELFGDNS